ncbi:MAG: MaoC family dehydratase [Actinobacteria bacterium]|nr:MaoC family dehydratase [Actinomycetota bacterium]
MDDLLHFDDFAPGREFALGTWEVTAEEIVEFGLAWDPLPFHTDPDAPPDGPYGGLIASGRHSGVIWMRLYVDAVLSRAATLGSPGLDEIRWHVPVRPGDVLTGTAKVLEARVSSSRPDRGIVAFEGTVVNQAGEVATTIRGTNFLRRRGE